VAHNVENGLALFWDCSTVAILQHYTLFNVVPWTTSTNDGWSKC